jgi:hypothetical protein
MRLLKENAALDAKLLVVMQMKGLRRNYDAMKNQRRYLNMFTHLAYTHSYSHVLQTDWRGQSL